MLNPVPWLPPPITITRRLRLWRLWGTFPGLLRFLEVLQELHVEAPSSSSHSASCHTAVFFPCVCVSSLVRTVVVLDLGPILTQ